MKGINGLLGKAIAIAACAHQNQVDKGGYAYILHPLHVMKGIGYKDIELAAIAVLHDVIENSDYTLADLRREGMTERVIAGVEAMTRLPDESYAEYIKRSLGNPDFRKVKKQDLIHNSDLRRLKNNPPTQRDFERVKNYMSFYAQIEAYEMQLESPE